MEQLRTLIIDPHNVITKIDLEYIRERGFLTEVVKNEQDALERAEKNHYEFIWLDVDEDSSINYPGLDLVYKIRDLASRNTSVPINGLTNNKNCMYMTNPKEFGLEVCVHWIDFRYFDKIIALSNKKEITINQEISKRWSGYCWFDESSALKTFCNNKSLLKEALKGMAFEQIPSAKHQLHLHHVQQHWVTMFEFVYFFQYGLRYLELSNLHEACEIFVSFYNRHDAQNLEGLYEFLIDIMDKTIFHLRCWIEKN